MDLKSSRKVIFVQKWQISHKEACCLQTEKCLCNWRIPFPEVIVLILKLGFIFWKFCFFHKLSVYTEYWFIPQRMWLSTDLESLLNDSVPRGILCQKCTGYGTTSFSSLLAFLLLLCLLQRIQGKFVFLHFKCIYEQLSIKSFWEEIISPSSSITFWFNCIHFIELNEKTVTLKNSLAVSKI